MRRCCTAVSGAGVKDGETGEAGEGWLRLCLRGGGVAGACARGFGMGAGAGSGSGTAGRWPAGGGSGVLGEGGDASSRMWSGLACSAEGEGEGEGDDRLQGSAMTPAGSAITPAGSAVTCGSAMTWPLSTTMLVLRRCEAVRGLLGGGSNEVGMVGRVREC